jgi:endo-1,4-beta-xylanase
MGNVTAMLTYQISLALAQVVVLWPNGAPGSEGKTAPESVRTVPAGDRVVSSVHKPLITAYLPSAPNGASVVIAPGGGHRELWADHEGHNVAKWLSERGVAGFVLHYRLAREKDSTYTIEGHALADTQRAIQVVRNRAAEWKLDPDRIGVMGFSAGGELAALAATRYDDSNRPAFQALIYPAIPKEMKLSKETPPAFLLCGENDRENISQGLPELYLALKRAGASAELHVLAGVGHGFGLRATTKGEAATWPERFYAWMNGRGFLKSTSARGVNWYSLEKEVALGRALADDVRRNNRPIDDEALRSYVTSLVARLNQFAQSPVPLSVEVVSAEGKNGPMALPGGFIFVPLKTLSAARDEAELAASLAHGLAHITARHGTRQATRGQIAGLSSVPLIFMGGWGYDHQNQLLPIGFRKFQEQFEADADRMAAEWMQHNPAETGEFAAMQARARKISTQQP